MTVVAGVSAKVAGGTAGVLSTGQRLGTALGIAAVGTVLFAGLVVGTPVPQPRAFIPKRSDTQRS